LPTTPFLILAAFFFARSHPEWEARLLAHPRAGPAILAWRDHRAIPLVAKCLATLMLGISAIGGWLTLPEAWRFVPGALGACVLAWMWSRPSVLVVNESTMSKQLDAQAPVCDRATKT